MYHQICGGVPWFNQPICKWAAARAEGKQAERPEGDLIKAGFKSEHWKQVYGRIIASMGDDGLYEVTAGGYRSHVLLKTDGTEYSTTGAYHLWVQEKPDTLDVTTKSGESHSFIILNEMRLAQTLLDLAHAGPGLEGTALAKNAMSMIASYETYGERKEDPEFPTVPAPGWESDRPIAVAAAPAPAASATDGKPAEVPPSEVAAKPRITVDGVGTAGPSQAKRQARSACLSKCIASCDDDANCERGCATTKCL
jgi:hypothetical protein